ncbi:MAG: adenosylcobinamide-phosphate synthase CbiB, partial [Anaerovoracaceae bacterium]
MTLIIGFVLDLIFGDPTMLPHPIRAIGNGIAIGEHGIRRIFPKSKGGEFVGGMILSLLVISLSFLVPFCILWFLAGINPWIAFIVESFMCYQILATKSLKKESMKVYAALTKGDLEGARFAVSMIVGRDTKALSSEGVAKATVETIAENTADGIVAPMLFMAIGGAPLGMMYKAINTLDSMIGYKNDQYRHFGTFAAKLDDVANYLPARLSAMFMIIGAVIGGFDGRNAIRIFKR